MAVVATLITQLRQRLQDDRWTCPAFVITCLDKHASSCLLEVSNGNLRTTVLGGSSNAVDLVVNLTTGYPTVGKLLDFLKSTYPAQYNVQAMQAVVEGHATIDLELMTNVDIARQPATIRTHRFSDIELEMLLRHGCYRHNPTYTVESLPTNEEYFVLTLAHIEGLRMQATDATKRRGLESDVQSLIALADAYERGYQADIKRIGKGIGPVKPPDEDSLGAGDVVLGEVSRLSLRSGAMGPGRANVGPQPIKIFDIDPLDVTDFAIGVRWQRSRHDHPYTIELWRDTQPNVRRSSNPSTNPTTSVRVWDSRAHYTSRAVDSWGTVDAVGELVTTFFDGMIIPEASQPFPTEFPALEPGTAYYYRLYLCDVNGEYSKSEVVSASTKTSRALLSRAGDALVPATGPRAGATAITINGSGFVTGTTVTIGGKLATSIVIVSATQITAVTPATSQFAEANQDVVLQSPNGLKDVLLSGWTYT